MEIASSAAAAASPKKPPPKRFIKNAIPDSILNDPSLNAAISLLPRSYDFEVHKTVARLRSSGARKAALQMPDGLLMYSLTISDILLSSCAPSLLDVLVLGDPTYGACCVDDIAAHALGADFLVHYGHSCLVPVPSSLIPVLYVFVDVKIDVPRLVSAVESALPPPPSKLSIAGTVQFLSAVHAARAALVSDGYEVVVPQARPLSPGEVLGCTSPTIPKSLNVKAGIFVADGRFHLEAFMIANPGIKVFRYDPFLGCLVLEQYDHLGMKRSRKDAILAAREARSWGVVLGTLGRQGSTRVLDRVVGLMEEKGLDYTVVLMSEISPARIELFGDSIDAWVQIACPRLSIDWGEGFKKPLLTTFELEIALGLIPGWWERKMVTISDVNEDGRSGFGSCSCGSGGDGCESGHCKTMTDYPMDYYAQDGGDWNSSYAKKKASIAVGNSK